MGSNGVDEPRVPRWEPTPGSPVSKATWDRRESASCEDAAAQEVAPQIRLGAAGASLREGPPGAWPRSPSSFRRAVPPPRPGPWAGVPVPRTRPPPATLGAMALPGARARCRAAAALAARRRHRAEGAGGQPSSVPPSQRAALYVHWPYCEKRCSYCNFNKYIPRGVEEAAVRSCLVTEAQTLLRLSGVRCVESVFFGGGTPSLASPYTVAAVLEAVAQAAHLPADTEVTLEANPTSAPGSRLAAFGKAGVNRLSIGLQSLDDTELQLLGRTHSASEALRTLAAARRLFPGRVSVDLMLGLPAQRVEPWLGQLQELLCHCDDHISLYQLSLERGTSLFTQVQEGTLPSPDPERAAEMYQEGRAALREAGFRQYEVSNFARNGALSTHNWTYWQCGQYLGVGPGAHGRFIPQGAGAHTREARIQTLEPDNWMKEVQLWGHGTRKRVPLGQLEQLEEVLAMGLRTDVGITHQHWQQFEPQLTLWGVFGANKEVKVLLEQGFLLLDHRGLRCSWEGLAVLDSLLLTLLPRLQEAWQQRIPSPVPGG
ncbi:radical S-adenosyl methionine domain-containing protein 1, mitochondrial [Dasypus novemcinctus]|uniref:radical S-adenosyl methionine domain-containing protein 1, mitochondrial n=1 Tax=Dasypus novemcinctus TaxID=9361 RepID=UPI000C830A66|nr:radical S-adenosyl methionine domain-containing protein 1, mitochondrial isoform X1 [Dasypus novemcinctus]